MQRVSTHVARTTTTPTQEKEEQILRIISVMMTLNATDNIFVYRILAQGIIDQSRIIIYQATQ